MTRFGVYGGLTNAERAISMDRYVSHFDRTLQTDDLRDHFNTWRY